MYGNAKQGRKENKQGIAVMKAEVLYFCISGHWFCGNYLEALTKKNTVGQAAGATNQDVLLFVITSVSCNHHRIFPLPGENGNICRITLLSSPHCTSLFAPFSTLFGVALHYPEYFN